MKKWNELLILDRESWVYLKEFSWTIIAFNDGRFDNTREATFWNEFLRM